MNRPEKHKDVDELLKRLFNEDSKTHHYNLHELFERRLIYLDITKHQASKILGLDQKTIDSFLSGDTKKLDFVTILKLSDFLEISHEEIVNKYFELVRETHSETIVTAKKRSFLVNNFNLPALKKIGFIDSINDFDHIEKKVLEFFGYDNIFDHSKHIVTAAFSAGKRETNKENLNFWYAAACQSLEKTPNPNEYDREGLISYFPQIRWHSMNVEKGLLLVAQMLFKLGVTLIIVPKFTTDLHLRGATLAYRDKPCIVLTKYTKFYATLWFALIHELFHVLYDWDEIKNETYHISGETESIKINEAEANHFARQYLFSDEKMKSIEPHINDPAFVKRFAEQNHVHPSIIYTFYSWDHPEENGYAKYSKFMPSFESVMQRFRANDFLSYEPIKKISTERNINISYTL